MSSLDALLASLLGGPLASRARLPLLLTASLCALRPRFLPKGRAGRGHRAVARNGRVLLASDLPVEELAGRVARARLQLWHKALLPSDTPRPWGLLLCIRTELGDDTQPTYHTRFVSPAAADQAGTAELTLDVGGGMVLGFFRFPGEPGT
jgi:hypothetical protein